MNGWDSANLLVAPLAGGMGKTVVRGGHYGRYVTSGHLIYMQQGTLFAVRFDLDRLETVGPAEQVVEGVSANAGIAGSAQLAVSLDGTLVYVPEVNATVANPIDWKTRDGRRRCSARRKPSGRARGFRRTARNWRSRSSMASRATSGWTMRLSSASVRNGGGSPPPQAFNR